MRSFRVSFRVPGGNQRIVRIVSARSINFAASKAVREWDREENDRRWVYGSAQITVSVCHEETGLKWKVPVRGRVVFQYNPGYPVEEEP